MPITPQELDEQIMGPLRLMEVIYEPEKYIVTKEWMDAFRIHLMDKKRIINKRHRKK